MCLWMWAEAVHFFHLPLLLIRAQDNFQKGPLMQVRLPRRPPLRQASLEESPDHAAGKDTDPPGCLKEGFHPEAPLMGGAGEGGGWTVTPVSTPGTRYVCGPGDKTRRRTRLRGAATPLQTGGRMSLLLEGGPGSPTVASTMSPPPYSLLPSSLHPHQCPPSAPLSPPPPIRA